MGITLAHRRYSAVPDRMISCLRIYFVCDPLGYSVRRSSDLTLDENDILNHDFEQSRITRRLLPKWDKGHFLF